MVIKLETCERRFTLLWDKRCWQDEGGTTCWFRWIVNLSLLFINNKHLIERGISEEKCTEDLSSLVRCKTYPWRWRSSDTYVIIMLKLLILSALQNFLHCSSSLTAVFSHQTEDVAKPEQVGNPSDLKYDGIFWKNTWIHFFFSSFSQQLCCFSFSSFNKIKCISYKIYFIETKRAIPGMFCWLKIFSCNSFEPFV